MSIIVPENPKYSSNLCGLSFAFVCCSLFYIAHGLVMKLTGYDNSFFGDDSTLSTIFDSLKREDNLLWDHYGVMIPILRSVFSLTLLGGILLMWEKGKKVGYFIYTPTLLLGIGLYCYLRSFQAWDIWTWINFLPYLLSIGVLALISTHYKHLK